MKNKFSDQLFSTAGLFTLSIRLVLGWTYFSAFWRRLVLDNKLIPEEAGYIGEKFNHFLPNALGIKPLIEFLVSHPDALQASMIAFTVIEAIVGGLVMLGLFSRLMGIGVFSLAMGILLGSGWLGTTCLDEWQIGVLGIAGGFTLFLTGSGMFSVDDMLIRKEAPLTRKKWFQWLGSGVLPIRHLEKFVLCCSLLIFGLTLYTNQYFHGGVFGTLHNKSVKPKIEISDASFVNSQLKFQVYRTEGADVYGSFLIGIQVLNAENRLVFEMNADALSTFDERKIHNYYVAKVKTGKHSMIIPLGAKADLTLDIPADRLAKTDRYTLKLIDISGAEWRSTIANN
ncbi:TQO small subunit DoxD [Sphingobacterium bambusae]|uniref:TQO small subunit DoxD n=1 Tax=Sphingobacterium bambusae TaxID=662858 RepID=A0ABW6BD95_9SPHI|nr:TQO small subunit DoxD [Sphingobacterium bambusae]WPL48782.1 TQO small subunit DoxD [Sphingobacterium bambusae]